MLARGTASAIATFATFATIIATAAVGCAPPPPPAAGAPTAPSHDAAGVPTAPSHDAAGVPTAPSPAAAGTPKAAPGYDAALARRLGADEYGMHKYVLALLKKGPNRTQPPEEAKRLMQAHLANISRLADEGSLVVAGPFLDDGPLSGIYVFKVETVEAARALTETDPAIRAGRLEMELHPWYGTAALQELNGLHKRLEKKSVVE